MTSLRLAIQARNIGVERIVQSGISAERADALLNDAEPSIDELRLIAKGLSLPIRELLLGNNAVSAEHTRLRTNFGRDISSELEWEASLATSRAQDLGEFIGSSALPEFADFPKSASTAEELAHIVRSNLLGLDNSTPIFDPAAIFYEKLQLVTVISHYRSIEGASSRAGGAALMLLASRAQSRMRFTFCHEVCHLLVDLKDGNEEVWLDDSVLSNRQAFNFEEEAFANAFAAAILLPRQGITSNIKKFRAEFGGPSNGFSAAEIMSLARKFGTSLLVTCIRLENLELLPAGAGQTLQASLSKEYGSPEKFATSIGLEDEQRVDWKYAARRMLEDYEAKFLKGEFSLEFISNLAGLSLTDAMEVGYGRIHH